MADELSIQQIRSLMQSVGPAEISPAPSGGAARAGAPTEGPSFADTLKTSIDEINTLHLEADKQIEELATGNNTDIQGTILALQKADISFRLMMEVRNKIIAAYQEVMRTQV